MRELKISIAMLIVMYLAVEAALAGVSAEPVLGVSAVGSGGCVSGTESARAHAMGEFDLR